MSSSNHTRLVILPQLTVERLANLCGALHQNFSLIEHHLNIQMKLHDNELSLSGNCDSVLNRAQQIIVKLYQTADKPVAADAVTLLLNQTKDPIKTMSQTIKLTRKTIIPKNDKQAHYLEGIDKKDIVFAVGPAGTGKTYLAVSKAIECYEKGEVQRLIFVRPAVEAGEKLGFLPGDLVEKVLPYLRPIYDSLYEMIGFKETQRLIQSDVIEVLPLAFMRGRTLNEAFIILDEAQNTTKLQMKMFLTRMGFGSKSVITGDMTQVDLPRDLDSGLAHAITLFNTLPEISIHTFTSQEVVRHPLVSKIVECYEAGEKK